MLKKAGEVEVMGKPTFSLWVTVMKSSLGDLIHILGADMTSPACVTLYWSCQMPQLGNYCYHHLAKELQAMRSRNFHLSPTESVLQRSGCYHHHPGGDGKIWTPHTLWIWGMLQTHRAECSAEAGPTCANHAMFNVVKVFFLSLMRFISTLETSLVSAVSSHKGLYSSTGWLPPAMIQECQLLLKAWKKQYIQCLIQVDACCPTLGMSMSLIGVAFHLDFLAASCNISFFVAGFWGLCLQ